MLKIAAWLLALCVSASAQTVPAVNSTAPAIFFSSGLDGGGVPVISSCGTSPTVAGKDLAGTITVGAGVVTSCTLTFSVTQNAVPVCVVSTNNTAVAGGVTTTTTTLVIALSATLGDGKIHYICRVL